MGYTWETVPFTSSARPWSITATIAVKREMIKRVRPRRDFEAWKERRFRSGAVLEGGVAQADVARELDASRETASTWPRRQQEVVANLANECPRAAPVFASAFHPEDRFGEVMKDWPFGHGPYVD
jgi:hypothetical protein